MYLVSLGDVNMLRYERIVAIPAGVAVLVWPKDGHADLIVRAHGELATSHFWRTPYGEPIGIMERDEAWDVYLSDFRVASPRSPEGLSKLITYCATTIPYVAQIETPTQPHPITGMAWKRITRHADGWRGVAVGRATPDQRQILEWRGWQVATSVDITHPECHITLTALTGLAAWPAKVVVQSDNGIGAVEVEFETVLNLNLWADVAL